LFFYAAVEKNFCGWKFREAFRIVVGTLKCSMKMHGIETEDITKNHKTKKLVIEKLNKNNINISRPVVKYSETVVHYSSNLPLTAIPQVATKVGNTADVTEGHQRIEEK